MLAYLVELHSLGAITGLDCLSCPHKRLVTSLLGVSGYNSSASALAAAVPPDALSHATACRL